MKESFSQKIKKTVTGKRGISFLFILASTILAAVMLIAYTKTGISTFTPTLSGKVRLLLGICIALGALLCVFELKNGKYVLYLLLLWTLLEFLIYEASYISNVFVGIDGNSLSAGFLTTTVSGLLACLTALISAILQKKEFGSGKPDEEEKAS